MVFSLYIFRKEKNMIFNIYASFTPYSNLLKTIDQYPCLKDYQLDDISGYELEIYDDYRE